jgi:hypothetical protein
MASTNKREVLTCVAFAYFAHKKSKSNINDFENTIINFYDGDTNSLSPLKQYLSPNLDIDRIREFDNKSKGGNKLSPFVLEIASAYWSAEVVFNTKKLYSGSFSNYIFLDQNNPDVKILKDNPLEKIKDLLEISESVPADILSSIDIFMIHNQHKNKVISKIEKHILNESDVQILNNLAYGTTGRNTYRTMFNEFFHKKYLIPISLKKIQSQETKRVPKQKASIEIVGTENVDKSLQLLVDPYTEFLGRVATLKNKTELQNIINDMVELDDNILLGDDRTYFQVNFELNYKKVNITDKVQKAYIEIGRTGFNGSKVGPQPWFGGASYTVTLPILRRYSGFSTMIQELVEIREKSFNYAVDKKIASKLSSEYNKAKSKITDFKLLLYSENDLIVVKDFCLKYDQIANNGKDSYQEFRIAVINLCKNRSIKHPSTDLRRLDKLSVLKNKNTSLQNQFAHSQGIWMYTRKNGNMKDYFKKQITLTLYGLMTKKGAKIFESQNQTMLIEDAFVKEIKAKNNTKKLAKFIVAPHIIID